MTAPDDRDPAPLGEVLEARALANTKQARQSRTSPSTRSHADPTDGDDDTHTDVLLRRAYVPEQYRTATWDQIQRNDTRQNLQTWRDDADRKIKNGTGALLFGDTGVGKSSVAALLVGEAVKRGHTARWFYTPDLCDHLLSSSRHRVDLRSIYLVPHVIVLDDFGVRPFSDWEIGLLDQIVENRYRRRKSMIVTTNLDADTVLKSRTLQRMADRWRECNDVLVIAGKSMRSRT